MSEDYMNDPEFQELISQYIDYLRESLLTLKDNLTNEKFSEIQQLGHNIKGSGGGYGFQELSELGHGLESAAKNQEGEKIAGHIEQLESFLDNYKKK